MTGGGLGSGSLNGLIAQIAPELLSGNPKLSIALIAGQQHQAETEKLFSTMPEAQDRVRVIGFTPDFYRFSGAADLILCRAGASTLAEFAIQHKACVVIPAGQLAGGHQLANIKQLQTAGAAKVLKDPSPENVLTAINDLLQNDRGRQTLGDKLGSLAKPNAAKDLANLILDKVAA